MIPETEGADPRLGLHPEDAVPVDDPDPQVSRPPKRNGAVLTVAAFTGLAGVLFVLLDANRTSSQPASLVTATTVVPVSSGDPPPLRVAGPPAPAPAAPAPGPVAPLFGGPPPPLPVVSTGAAGVSEALQRRRAPTMVVDLGAAADAAAGPPAAGPGGGSMQTAALSNTANLPGGAPGTQGGSTLGADEQFADRINDSRPDRARAVTLRNLDTLIPQGATILAVLETAINSDLPGYARAIVSRDVMSFDGSTVLIPKGSRVIGQYKNAVSLGASRAFVIWTRIIRPDGVSIQINSPGGDALGRGGLAGDVNRHFFQRFGGSILLSVLNAGVASASNNPTTSISIGSPGAAVGAASSALGGDAIPPTINVRQGAVVNIFVARDLDFSGVGPVS